VLRAKAVNTLGEPMDGAWYTHRHYWHPLSNPEMATAADMISARFLHALGYHVYDSYLVYFDRRQLL
jgi:hypothetical protein